MSEVKKIALVGGGLAGSSLAKLFNERKILFDWYYDDIHSASHISSGILNPVTGRRYALAWKYDELIVAAKKLYGNFLLPIKLDKHYTPFKEGNTIEEIILGKEKYLAKLNENWVEVKESYQLRTKDFMQSIKDEVENLGQIKHEEFAHKNLIYDNHYWLYNHNIYSKVIFAEGIFVKKNPFFKHIPFQLNRGEALVLDIAKNKPESVKKYGKFICPFGEKFWVGSSFDKVDSDAPLLTEKTRLELQNAIPNLVEGQNYKIINHIGALRSTTLDRRPIVGEHPVDKGLFVFNGFGTKGASLIPWCAEHLLLQIFKDIKILRDISIERYQENYY